MATRSTIAIELKDGTIRMIYCHWDGYISHNGAILKKCYDTEEKVLELIELGDLSSLGATIKDCVAYGRDNHEKGTACQKCSSFLDYKLSATHEYNYLFKNGKWLVSRNNKKVFFNYDILDKTEIVEESYYTKELKVLGENVKCKFTSETNETKFMDLNPESAEAILKYIRTKFPNLK